MSRCASSRLQGPEPKGASRSPGRTRSSRDDVPVLPGPRPRPHPGNVRWALNWVALIQDVVCLLPAVVARPLPAATLNLTQFRLPFPFLASELVTRWVTTLYLTRNNSWDGSTKSQSHPRVQCRTESTATDVQRGRCACRRQSDGYAAFSIFKSGKVFDGGAGQESRRSRRQGTDAKSGLGFRMLLVDRRRETIRLRVSSRKLTSSSWSAARCL